MSIMNAVIGALRINMGIDSAEVETGAKRVEGRFDRMGKTVEKSMLAVAAGVAAAGAAIAISVKRSIDHADEMGKASQKYGIAVDELSRLRHAADLSGVSFETVGKGAGRMARNMLDAAQGLKAPQRAFDMLGISITDSDGKLRNVGDVIPEVAARFGAMEDGAAKTALALTLFGRAGAEMIPMLNMGADGLRAMMNEADELGIVIDSKTAKAAENFNDNISRMRSIVDGLWQQLTARLAPGLERISELLLAFAKDKARVTGFFDGIADAVKWVVQETMRAITVFENLGASLSQFGKSFVEWFKAVGRGDPEAARAAWKGWGDVMDANLKRVQATEAAVNSLWSKATPGGFSYTPAATNDNTGDGGVPPIVDETAEKEREQMMRRLERLREQFMTEEEVEAAHYQKRLEQLAEFEEARAIGAQESADLRAKIEQDYNDRVARAQEERLNAVASTIGSTGSIIESLTKIMGKEGDKQLGIVKALSLAEALINVYTGITAALRLPFPYNMAAAAAVAAKGMATIASMKSVSKGGGSTAGAASGGGAAPADAGASGSGGGESRTLFIKGINPGDLLSGDMVRGLMEQIVEKQNDGYKIVMAA